MMFYGLYGFKSKNVAIFDQKSDFGGFSTSENNTWVRRSAEIFSAWTTNINYFLQKNFMAIRFLENFFWECPGGNGRSP